MKAPLEATQTSTRRRERFWKLPCAGAFCTWTFFKGGRMVQRVVSANADTPVHDQGHDEHEALHALGMREWRILQVEAPAVEVGEPRRDGPARRLIEHTCPRVVMTPCANRLTPVQSRATSSANRLTLPMILNYLNIA